MKNIICPECSRLFNDEYKSCPHCGKSYVALEGEEAEIESRSAERDSFIYSQVQSNFEKTNTELNK